LTNIKEITFIDVALSKIETLIEGLRSEVVLVKLRAARPCVEALARAIGAEIAVGPGTRTRLCGFSVRCTPYCGRHCVFGGA
jgi:hypothetical protein